MMLSAQALVKAFEVTHFELHTSQNVETQIPIVKWLGMQSWQKGKGEGAISGNAALFCARKKKSHLVALTLTF
jgi:hypothetical protein